MTTSVSRPTLGPWIPGARVMSAVSVAILALLYVTAGQYLQSDRLESLHGLGSIALHVTTGVLTLCLAAHAVATGRDRSVAVGAAALFGLTFLQASFGSGTSLNVHVPMALATTAAVLVLTFWTFAYRRTDDR